MVGYLRVSAVDQEHGIHAQGAVIQSEADRHGWQVEWMSDEGKSPINWVVSDGCQCSICQEIRSSSPALIDRRCR